MKRTEPIAVGELLSAMIGNSDRLKTAFAENRVLSEWSNVVGPIAEEIKDIYLRDGVLWVVCPSSLVRNEIMMRRSLLVAELNRRAGANVVKMIRVRF